MKKLFRQLVPEDRRKYRAIINVPEIWAAARNAAPKHAQRRSRKENIRGLTSAIPS